VINLIMINDSIDHCVHLTPRSKRTRLGGIDIDGFLTCPTQKEISKIGYPNSIDSEKMTHESSGPPLGRDRPASSATVEGIVLIVKAVIAFARAVPRACTFAWRKLRALRSYEHSVLPFLVYVAYPQGKRQRQGIQRARRINAKLRKFGVTHGPESLIQQNEENVFKEKSCRNLSSMSIVRQPDPAMVHGAARRGALLNISSNPAPDAAFLGTRIFSETNGTSCSQYLHKQIEEATSPNLRANDVDGFRLQNVTMTRGNERSSRRHMRTEV
jgi:hypothetical protein